MTYAAQWCLVMVPAVVLLYTVCRGLVQMIVEVRVVSRWE